VVRVDGDEWPHFDDSVLEEMKEAARTRADSLWLRGRFFVDGSTDRGDEHLTLEFDTHTRRRVTMVCRPGGAVVLEIRSMRRSEGSRVVLRLAHRFAGELASHVVEAYEETLSHVMRAGRTNDFCAPVRRLWQLAAQRSAS
jgi:hypothetical protein